MNLKEKIRELCKREGVTAQKVEQDCGFAQGFITKIDKSSPSVANIRKIADYFGVSIDYLMDVNAKEHYINEATAKVAQEISENRELALLFDAARDAAPEDIQAVHAMLLALKRKEQHNG